MGKSIGDLLCGSTIQSRRKCFISYYRGDSAYVDRFVRDFEDVFIPKLIGVSSGDDFINSDDSDYVMSKIREKYLGDSTVTICLLGDCTHSRCFIDWELKASLRQGLYEMPNGLLGILLPYKGNECHLPSRFKDNHVSEKGNESYAIYRAYPTAKEILRQWIEAAFQKRETHASLITNTQTMMKNNKKCSVHDITH